MTNEESPLKCKECRFRSDNRGINSTLKFDISSALEGFASAVVNMDLYYTRV